MKKCNACLSLIDNEESLICSKCYQHYHESCIQSTFGFASLRDITNWMCPDCQPRNKNADNTPIRPYFKSKQIRDENVNRRRGGIVINFQPLTPITVVEVRDNVKSEIKNLLKHLNDTIASSNSQFCLYRIKINKRRYIVSEGVNVIFE
ncbi:unnamed protein product [Parnassius mnemosyne]|uniref:PHD-type domain-containing protein n=1 Tax=Parnassius mnemosyne TaxID=213953 RepID=A0AAV1KDU9_9NEOP